jgi:Ca2+-binding RTX toxin-like protein
VGNPATLDVFKKNNVRFSRSELVMNPTDNLGLVATSIKPLLETVKSTISTQVLNQLPILNGLELKPYAEQFITNEVEQRILDELNKVQDQNVASVKQALYNALKPTSEGGLGLLQDPGEQDLDGDGKSDGDGNVNIDDIKIISNANSIEFKFKLGKVFNSSLPLDTNLGLPNLGLALEGNVTPELKLGVTVGFGVDNTSFVNGQPHQDAFFINTGTTNEIEAGINTKFVDGNNVPLNFTGSLGFLKLKATDNGTNLTSEFSADITSPVASANGRVKFSNFGDVSVALNPTLTAKADLKLKINTGDLNAVMPSISTDFNLVGLQYDSITNNFITPTVEFNNVALDLGSFVKNFAGEVFSSIQKVTEPFDPIIDRLNKPLPIIKASLLDLAEVLAKSGLGNIDPGTQKFIAGLADVVEIVDTINSLSADSLNIDFGNYHLNGANASGILTQTRTPKPVLEQLGVSSNAKSASVLPSFAIASTNTSSLVKDWLSKDSPFQFPFLTEPSSVVSLLLGRSNVELFTYQTPKLGFDFRLDLPSVPVFGPIFLKFGGEAGAGAQVKFGFDTKGFVAFKNGNFSEPEQIFDGFFVSRPDPVQTSNNLSLFGGLTAEAGVGIGIAEIAAGGGIFLTVGLNAVNKNEPENSDEYFKVRGSTIANTNPLCLFDPTGALSALLFASIKLDFGFFEFTKRFKLANINIIDFSLGSGGCDPSKPHYDVEDPEPDPEIQAKLAGQGIIDRRGTATDDLIALKATSSSKRSKQNAVVDPRITLSGLDPEPKAYEDIQLIAINSGDGDDRIELIGVGASGQLEGGSGNDTLIGGAGIDFLNGGAGNDVLDGKDGKDGKNAAVYANAPAGVFVDLANGFANDGYGTTDTLSNIQNVEGTIFNDTLIANSAGSLLDVGAGDDELFGGNGKDVMLAGAGADFIDGAGGTDTTTYLGSPASVYVNLTNQDVFIISPLDRSPILLKANAGFGGDAEGDRIFNVENVQGSIYDDILVALGSNANIDGLLGNDLIVAGLEAQVLDGNVGIDWVTYSQSDSPVDVSLRAGEGSRRGKNKKDILKLAKDDQGKEIKGISSFEHLEGSNFSDNLEGDRQDNIIRGLAGDDTIDAGDGKDTLIGGVGGDRLDGGVGEDWADYSDSPAFVNVNLATAIGLNGHAAGDTFVQNSGVATVENLRGSRYEDILSGDAGNNKIAPGLSNRQIDLVDGGLGNDLLMIDYSINDFGTGVTGGFQGDAFGYLSRNTSNNGTVLDAVSFVNIDRLLLIGTIKADQVTGGSGDDVLLPGAGDDVIDGGSGNDEIRGDDGNDILIGGVGADTLDGGNGWDKTSYITSPLWVSIDLVAGVAYSGGDFSLADKLISLEEVEGSLYNDVLTGNDEANYFNGSDGDDFLVGRGGADTLNGAAGTDRSYYVTSPAAVNINLKNGTAYGGDAEGDILISIEDLVGSDYDDILSGNNQGNVMTGGEGNDLLQGDDGNDILIGIGINAGALSEVDTLTGGAGADLFLLGDEIVGNFYDDKNSSTSGTNNYALVTDFNPAEGDRIYLSGRTCDYRFVEAPPELPSGIAIYTTGTNELIAVTQGTFDPNAIVFMSGQCSGVLI